MIELLPSTLHNSRVSFGALIECARVEACRISLTTCNLSAFKNQIQYPTLAKMV
jgi:hypothetical protein